MKVAIYTHDRVLVENEQYIHRYTTYCECGAKHEGDKTLEFCDKCKHNLVRRWIHLDSEHKCFSFTRYDLVSETHYGFVIHNYSDTYKFDGESLKYIKTSNPYKLIVNFKDDIYKLVDRKSKESDITECRGRVFFESSWDFKNKLKLKGNLEFIDIIENLGNLKSYGCSAARAFDKIFKDVKLAKVVQVLTASNIEKNLIKNLIISGRWGDCRRDIKRGVLNVEETKPHKILNINKGHLRVLKYYPSSKRFSEWITYINDIDTNNLKYMIEMLEDQLNNSGIMNFFADIDLFIELVDTYNYNSKMLIKYIIRDIKLEQGIDSYKVGLELLRDLNKMCKDMGIAPKQRYSKSLKLHHDIVMSNYKVSIDEIRKNKFSEAVNKKDYIFNEYKTKELSVVSPKEPNELIKEGDDMHHCVASYINSVIDKKCKIYFIRENERPDKSLVTVEVRNEGIVQAKAFGNAKPTVEQKRFISLWAKNKNLTERYY